MQGVTIARMDRRLFSDRFNRARSIVVRCIGRRGVYAGTSRYRYQCWTRDFALAGLDALLDMGLGEHARCHLEEIARRQEESGKVPIMYVSNPFASTLIRAREFFRDPKRSLHQAELYLKTTGLSHGFSLSNLTPWTTDAEPLFIIACHRFSERTGDAAFIARMRPHILKAFRYIEHNSMREGFMVGGDWRDTVGAFKDAVLLSNNALLAAAYAAAGEPQNARELRNRIVKRFWTGSYYRDRLGSNSFDLFGESLAVLSGIAEPDEYPSILDRISYMTRDGGVAANELFPGGADKVVREYVDHYGTVWPFTEGFFILALIVMGQREWALREFARWSSRKGFCEWYEPHEKAHCGGEHEQMWSAALYLRTHKALFPEGELAARESAARTPELFFPALSFS